MDKLNQYQIEFGQKLEKLLKEKGLSANKLSNAIEIDRASIGKYIKGESSPRLNTFLAICDALNVEPNYFLNANSIVCTKEATKTEQRKMIESLYCLCKNKLIEQIDYDDNGYPCVYCDYGIDTNNEHLLSDLINQCIKYAGSEYFDDIQVCEKIADKYEPLLIEAARNNH